MEVALQALPFLMKGLAVTLQVSALVVLISLVLGVALGVLLVYGPAPLQWLVRGYSDIIRGIPILVLIFAIYYGLPALKINLSSIVAAHQPLQRRRPVDQQHAERHAHHQRDQDDQRRDLQGDREPLHQER